MIRLELKNYNAILIEKQEKLSALSSGKLDKYEYFRCEETLPFEMIDQVKFILLSFGKGFRKTNKNKWRSRKKTI